MLTQPSSPSLSLSPKKTYSMKGSLTSVSESKISSMAFRVTSCVLVEYGSSFETWVRRL